MNTLRIARVVGFGTKPPQDFDQSPITFGTASSCTIRFDAAFDRGVAAHHARLEWNGEAWYLLDLGSPEGTWAEGRRLTEAFLVGGPLEFSLGQNGPKVKVEPLAATAPAFVPPVSAPDVRSSTRASQPGKLPMVLIAVVAVVLALAVGGWFFWKSREAARPSFAQVLNGGGGIDGPSGPIEPPEESPPTTPSKPRPKPSGKRTVSLGGHALGLKVPSSAEQTYLERAVPRAENVNLNPLAIQRGAKSALNGTMSAGQPVTFGNEVRSIVRKKGAAASAPKSEDGGLQLPSAVDNSKLPCFPPITSQGRLGSCTSFSMAYYAASHNTGLVHKWPASTDASRNFSPKWTYNMVNSGEDSGSSFLPIMNFLQRHGAPTLAEWPYSGDPSSPANYREWSPDPQLWQKALARRIKEIGTIRAVDTPGGLQILKGYLVNGYIGTFGTSVAGWKYAKSQPTPQAPADGSNAGQDVCTYIRQYPEPSGHAMTVVGYDDAMWVDVNENSAVDPGETGALKIANSWGIDGWAEFDPGTIDNGPSEGPRVGKGGFVWILYDALKEKSAIPGFAPEDRVPHKEGGGFWQNVVYYVVPYPEDYQPKLLAQFTITTDQRDSIDIRLGLSGPGAKKPEIIWRPGALALPQMTEEATTMEEYTGMGGPYGMNGLEGSSKATIVFDLTDLLNLVDNPDIESVQFFLMVNKLSPDAQVTVEDFSVIDAQGKALTAAQGLPGQIDAGLKIFPVKVALPGKSQ